MGSITVPRVKLGSQGLEVSQQGFGCFGMTMGYGPPKPEHDMMELIRKAVETGITFLDTADMFGPHTNEILIGKCFIGGMSRPMDHVAFLVVANDDAQAIKGIRHKVQIATKFGCIVNGFTVAVRGDPAYIREAVEGSLKRLGVDYLDLYYQHRVDSKVPIEITVGEMKKLVEEGKVKYLGLSEASAADIRRAHAVHPITAVQLEWSLWSRDVEEDVIPSCRELGIAIVPYSPLGRGFFSSGITQSEMDDTDWRRTLPRFQLENMVRNRAFYDRLVAIGATKKSTAGQLALAWLQHQGKDVVPIPGTTKWKNLEENVGALAVKLTEEELKEIEDAVPHNEVAGDRYSEETTGMTWAHTSSPPLSTWTETH